jgi:hypothetical protein
MEVTMAIANQLKILPETLMQSQTKYNTLVKLTENHEVVLGQLSKQVFHYKK